MIDLENCYLNVGLDFIDAFGVRTTNIQLVHKQRGAIALVDYENEKVTRCLYTNDVDKTSFLDEAKKLLENSIPISFKTNQLSIGPI